MFLATDNRKRALLLPLGLLILSMAVFGWGLQYKLSLYRDQAATQHRAPDAKLLSQKERPAAIQVLSDFSSPPVWPVVLLVALVFAATRTVPYHRGWQSTDPTPFPLPERHALFVRPPPCAFFPL